MMKHREKSLKRTVKKKKNKNFIFFIIFFFFFFFFFFFLIKIFVFFAPDLFTSVGAVTNVGTYKYLTHLTGNVGTNSGSSTNFGNVNGVMHDGDGASGQCASDLLIAYNS